jgi:hypothetical protein
MKILNENIEFTTFIYNEKYHNVYEIKFNLNTEKLIAKIKKTFNDMLKNLDDNKKNYLFEISYVKNEEEVREQFENIFKLIYRIKTI